MTRWIHNPIMRKVQHLDLVCGWSYLVDTKMDLSVYTCETLVSLKLCNVSLPDFEYVSLPRLKIMHLKQNFYSNDALLENLISSFPVLEDLTVIRNVGIERTVRFSRVRSQSLKSLVLVLDGQGDVTYDREVVIDAPRLKYLSLRDY
ncbi:unnamed protein product [Arabidopsis halleri]